MKTPAIHLFVKYENSFFSEESPVTVQVVENDIVMHCDHAGHHTALVEFTTPYFNGDAFEPTGSSFKKVEVCDKCDMWSPDGEEWYE